MRKWEGRYHALSRKEYENGDGQRLLHLHTLLNQAITPEEFFKKSPSEQAFIKAAIEQGMLPTKLSTAREIQEFILAREPKALHVTVLTPEPGRVLTRIIATEPIADRTLDSMRRNQPIGIKHTILVRRPWYQLFRKIQAFVIKEGEIWSEAR